MVRRHFNGLVIYPTEVPFRAFSDYGRYEKYAVLPRELRERNRAALNMGFEVCHRFGLETLMQQYITKYPGRLAKETGLPFYSLDSGVGEQSDFKHPVLYKFFRYMHERFFEQCPGLDRLMINFEAAPLSTEFNA